MPKRMDVFQLASLPVRGLNTRRLLPLVRVLSLVFLLLLPMQMRAGADDPHPHALLQLLLDARDGAIDHHTGTGHDELRDDHEPVRHSQEPAADAHAPANGVHEPDIPSFGDLTSAGGSMALLCAIVAFYTIPLPERARFWPAPARWKGWLPALDSPPPRIARV
ncbi:MAG: hypothetical protein H0T18_07545 [Chloroflexia bacterium]|nr:hypothetical protein [Chloroflexia bacterium]